MPAQIHGRHILPKFRFTFMKNVNIHNSLLCPLGMAAYPKAPIIRTGHWAVWVVHTMAYVPLRIIGTLEYSAVFCNNISVGIRFSQLIMDYI